MRGDVPGSEVIWVGLGFILVVMVLIIVVRMIVKSCAEWKERIEEGEYPKMAFKWAVVGWLGLTAAFLFLGYGISLVSAINSLQFWQWPIMTFSLTMLLGGFVMEVAIGDWGRLFDGLMMYVTFPLYILVRGIREIVRPFRIKERRA